jgi:hypothetical protein
MTEIMEHHPYNHREEVPQETRLLIIGTAPPPRFSNPAFRIMKELDFDFFYGSEDNYMWEFLDWPAPGSEDTELGVLMGPEGGHGETAVYARVQA